MIEAAGIEKSFGPVRALRGVALRVAAGEIVALFGPNGAGKSTLARCLAGLSRPDAGEVRIDGERARGAAAARLRSRLGYAGHGALLYDHLSAEENLAFFAALHGVPRPQERARALLEEFGIPGRAGDALRGLSRGTQQRLALARALVHEPAILLLDEPATGLDPAAAGALHDRLNAHRQKGGCALLVSHDLPAALTLADRYIVLTSGRIGDQGPAAGADPAALAARFSGATAGARA